MNAEYNDIVNWDYKGLVDIFGGGHKARKFAVRSKDELEKLFTDNEFNSAEILQFVELYMQREDAPRALVTTAEASARTNAKKE